MPRKEIDYSRTIIYKIVSNDLSIKECYVGHTTDFTNRKRAHKCYCNNESSKGYNLRIYNFIRDNGGWSNWSMIEIEKYSCNDLNEAKARERYWIETLQATLNCIIPLRNAKERYVDNKEEIREKHKEYYNDNKEEILQQQREYYDDNKEEIREKHKEYYENNKEKKLEKIVCECGSIVAKCHFFRHLKSDKHKNFLLST